MKEIFTMREEDVETLAHKVVHILSGVESSKAKVLLLDGDLGAGKTTFTKELASVIGIQKGKVNSPTFTLKKEYTAEHPVFRKLVHIDAYRFNTPNEAKVLRLEDDLEESDSIIAIEWPSKMKYLKADVHLLFTIIDDETREVKIMYEGE
jgi:tRNA threonylcarbamoyladenosine biosynthesis protein TsaE